MNEPINQTIVVSGIEPAGSLAIRLVGKLISFEAWYEGNDRYAFTFSFEVDLRNDMFDGIPYLKRDGHTTAAKHISKFAIHGFEANGHTLCDAGYLPIEQFAPEEDATCPTCLRRLIDYYRYEVDRLTKLLHDKK